MQDLEKPRPKFLKIGIDFEVKDLWIGVYWNINSYVTADYNIMGTEIIKFLFVYVCFIPCFPVIFRIRLK